MLTAKFYKIINSESSTVEFLQTDGLLPDNMNSSNCTKCDGITKINLRKKHLETEEVWK